METKGEKNYSQTTRATNAKHRERMKNIEHGKIEDTRVLNFVKQICDSKGVSMKQFGAAAGVSEQMMNWYFRVKDNCRLSMLRHIFRANGMEITPGVEVSSKEDIKTLTPKVTLIVRHTQKEIEKSAPESFIAAKDENHPLHILWQIYAKSSAKTFHEFYKQINATNDAGTPIKYTRAMLNYSVAKGDIDVRLISEIAQSFNLILSWKIIEN